MLFKAWKVNDELYFSKYKFILLVKTLKPCIPNIIITPALAFDLNGNRIGYGNGFYDKYYNSK